MIMTFLLRVIRVRGPQLLSLPGVTSTVSGQANTGTILNTGLIMSSCYNVIML